jgi:serine/threonine-protein kinase HipA
MYRRMVFNVLATDHVDHTKNFSFLLIKDQKWTLAPAYDLCFSFDPSNQWVSQQTLSVNDKKLNIKEGDLIQVVKENSIKNGKKIISQISTVLKKWPAYAQKAKVGKDQVNYINQHLNIL